MKEIKAVMVIIKAPLDPLNPMTQYSILCILGSFLISWATVTAKVPDTCSGNTVSVQPTGGKCVFRSVKPLLVQADAVDGGDVSD